MEKKKKTDDRIVKITLRFFRKVVEITIYDSKQPINPIKKEPSDTYGLPPGVYC